MGFTLGGVDELDDPEVLCCLAVDAGGTVHGVTSWLPVYDGGRLVSRTLDVMRRGPEGFPGVMEFLIASAVLELRDTVEVISLSGSPLASRPGDGNPPAAVGSLSAAQTAAEGGADNLLSILDLVGHALEPVYGFRSLAAFKSRFKPEYRSLYLYYQDPLHLPAIGRALTRAYLPGLVPFAGCTAGPQTGFVKQIAERVSGPGNNERCMPGMATDPGGQTNGPRQKPGTI